MSESLLQLRVLGSEFTKSDQKSGKATSAEIKRIADELEAELEQQAERVKALEAAHTALQNVVNAHEMYGVVTMHEMNEARKALAVTK